MMVIVAQYESNLGKHLNYLLQGYVTSHPRLSLNKVKLPIIGYLLLMMELIMIKHIDYILHQIVEISIIQIIVQTVFLSVVLKMNHE